MDFDQNNVLVGLSKLLVDGVSVGFTQGGVTIGLTTDRVDKEVDQSFSPVGILKVLSVLAGHAAANLSVKSRRSVARVYSHWQSKLFSNGL